MTTMMAGNGRAQRKSLSEQIDRLDGILDGLAGALNEAVAEAVREAVGTAVKEAVQAVLAEVLGRPEFLAMVRAGAAPAAEAAPAPAPRVTLTQRLAGARRRAGAVLANAAGAVAGGWRQVRTAGGSVRRRLEVVRRFGRQVGVAVAVGTVAGLAAFVAGPWLAALASGLGGFTSALAAQAALALRRLLAAAPDAGPI
jgi:hypothetical protein